MKKSESPFKKVYAKRVFTDKNEYSYIEITKQQFDSVIKSQEEKKQKGIDNHMIISKAPIWFVAKKRLSPFFIKWGRDIVLVIVTFLLTHFLEKWFGK